MQFAGRPAGNGHLLQKGGAGSFNRSSAARRRPVAELLLGAMLSRIASAQMNPHNHRESMFDRLPIWVTVKHAFAVVLAVFTL